MTDAALLHRLDRSQRQSVQQLIERLHDRTDLTKIQKRERVETAIVRLRREALPARYWLGECLDCNCELWVHRPRARVPLCRRCTDRRAQQAAIRRGPSGW